jgi:protein-disulfide isomerase
MFMKRLQLSFVAVIFLAVLPANAQQAELTKWVERSLPRCPNAYVTLEKSERQGPANFVVYRAVQKSSDENCASQKYVMFSPMTQQVIVGTIIALPPSEKPINARISEHATTILKTPIIATVAPFPLPDGIKDVTMTRDTEFGSFAYHGFLDSSGQFLLVGLRGNLREDAGTTLRKALQIDNGARRGKRDSALEIIELSDFQCPTCGRAHEKLEPLFAKSLGKVNFIRLDLPLFEHHQWAVPAAMGARAIQRVAPAKYWGFVDQVFKNQEVLAGMPFDTFLKNFVQDNDINWPAVEKIYRSKTERQALLDQVSRAFAVGIVSTPTFILNGQPIGFGDGNYAEETLKRAIGTTTAAAPAKKPAKK